MYFRRLTSSTTSLSMSGYMSGSPPGMLTMGAPHSSTARRHCSTVRCFLRTYPATVAIWEIGTLIDSRTPFVCHGGDGSVGPSTGIYCPTPDGRDGV